MTGICYAIHAYITSIAMPYMFYITSIAMPYMIYAKRAITATMPTAIIILMR